MKLRIREIIAASSALIGSILFTFAVHNLEFQDYCPDLPLISANKLIIAGWIAYIPFFIYMIRKD